TTMRASRSMRHVHRCTLRMGRVKIVGRECIAAGGCIPYPPWECAKESPDFSRISLPHVPSETPCLGGDGGRSHFVNLSKTIYLWTVCIPSKAYRSNSCVLVRFRIFRRPQRRLKSVQSCMGKCELLNQAVRTAWKSSPGNRVFNLLLPAWACAT